MARMSAYDNIKKAFQDFVAPEIQSLRGDMRALEQKIDSVETRLLDKITDLDARVAAKLDHLDVKLTTKIDSLRNETVSEIRRLDTRMDGFDKRMDGFDKRMEGFGRELGVAIDIRERLAALEARRPA